MLAGGGESPPAFSSFRVHLNSFSIELTTFPEMCDTSIVSHPSVLVQAFLYYAYRRRAGVATGHFLSRASREIIHD